MITPAKIEILLAIGNYKNRGFKMYPTVREIAVTINRSPSTVHEHIELLHRDRFLKKVEKGRCARNYKLTTKTWEALTR